MEYKVRKSLDACKPVLRWVGQGCTGHRLFFLHLGEVVDQRGRPIGRHVLPFQDVFLPLQLAGLPLQRVDVLASRLLGAAAAGAETTAASPEAKTK